MKDRMRIGRHKISELVVELVLPTESRFAVVEISADLVIFFVVHWEAFQQYLLADDKFGDGARFVDYVVSPPFCMCLLYQGLMMLESIRKNSISDVFLGVKLNFGADLVGGFEFLMVFTWWLKWIYWEMCL